MLNSAQLETMREVDITKAPPSSLRDIQGVHIDAFLPMERRMAEYVEQIGNPYCFLCDGTPVKLRFAAKKKTLAQSLGDYFISLK
jgi:hypothetical protein